MSLARFFFNNSTFVYYMAKKVLEASSMHFKSSVVDKGVFPLSYPQKQWNKKV